MKFFINLLSLLLLINLSFYSVAKQPPNLLIIQTDEHNFRTISAYRNLLPNAQGDIWGKGNNVDTPNIDRLAKEGAIAMNFYSSAPVCTPSRASFVTGLRPYATGAPSNGEHLSKNVKTFAHVLEENGYSTSYVGKWHLAGHGKYLFDIKYKAGFTDNRYMMTGGHAPYFHIQKNGLKGIGAKQASKLPKNEIIHLTDYFTDKALEILERDKNKPFALMVSIPDPHTPDHARPPYDKMYEHLKPIAPTSMSQKYSPYKPRWAKGGDKNDAKKFNPTPLIQYFGMVKHIDDNVGKLLSFLEKNNLAENTIVVFTADHGDMFFEHKRLNKSVPFEAAARIPFLIRYPNSIPAGKVIRKAYTTMDFAPTILDIMEVKNDVPFQGLNAGNDFSNDKKLIEDSRVTYYEQGWVAAVDNRYKLILDVKEKPWLYDLQNDPNEQVNQYNNPTYKTVVERLKKSLFEEMKKNNEPSLEKTFQL
ncbi:sulfatase-like hydrolase/transferase [Pseudocolwellia agarivorans]|uniref:sulfatase-like hydrolase/transferase n=1 Tax=Pseudocolwellia agarivorans TaxID=1911682 RepID=UPI0009865B58|nr:sulfatase-like hydrolase/transferase [Pseudocolwellia agarivorans]